MNIAINNYPVMTSNLSQTINDKNIILNDSSDSPISSQIPFKNYIKQGELLENSSPQSS